jgi:hypothetical protein
MKEKVNRLSWWKLLFTVAFLMSFVGHSQSIIRQWNEIVLEAIENDFARPPVHARNLYHLSAMSHDIWVAYEGDREFHFLGKTINGYTIPFDGVKFVTDKLSAQNEAISFASYRLLLHRFENSPGIGYINGLMEDLMQQYGYDISNNSTNIVTGGAAEFGNWVAQEVINFGLQDGSNEANNYQNMYYVPTNPPIQMEQPGNPDVIDPNKWQAIELSVAFDQAGNPITGPQDHLAPEWGNVMSFSLDDSLSTLYLDGAGNTFKVFCDPGSPALIDVNNSACMSSLYKWNHLMVSIWQSHNTPNDGVIWDVSPGAIGNVPVNYPEDIEDHYQFYNYFDGGHADEPGHPLNPFTGLPYASNLVRRGDYVRVVAEYWADGLNSETPPGHWFRILHDVLDHPLFEKRWMGVGPILDDLEYDALSHFVLGGMMHDAAIAAWSIKGWYDYTRPAAAIRWLGDNGQCSDPLDISYSPNGLPIIPGYSELVYSGDPLAGPNDIHVGKMKLYTWRGHDYVVDPETDIAGVGWILSEDWWPYQLPTFVTPPFAGYVSGHSTFSATAANVLALITGDPFFPGGIMEKTFLINDFLEFEQGPSNTVVLQWATYKDASDQCSLSRIWGGIHPPVDDIPGRIIGDKIGPLGVQYANSIIEEKNPKVVEVVVSNDSISEQNFGSIVSFSFEFDMHMDLAILPDFMFINQNPIDSNVFEFVSQAWVDTNIFLVDFLVLNTEIRLDSILWQLEGALAISGETQKKTIFENMVWIDTEKPVILNIQASSQVVNMNNVQNGFTIGIKVSEDCDPMSPVLFEIVSPSQLQSSLLYSSAQSYWYSPDSLILFIEVVDNDDLETEITVKIDSIFDVFGNSMVEQNVNDLFVIDTQSPDIVQITANKGVYSREDFGVNTVEINAVFSKTMDTSVLPTLSFPNSMGINDALTYNPFQSAWVSSTACVYYFHMPQSSLEIEDVDVQLIGFADTSGNSNTFIATAVFSIDTKQPQIESLFPVNNPIFDGNKGASGWQMSVVYSEPMDNSIAPYIQFDHPDGLMNSITYSPTLSFWESDTVYNAVFNVVDNNIERENLTLTSYFAKDIAGNEQLLHQEVSLVNLDTRNPQVTSFSSSTFTINNQTSSYQHFILFDEDMDLDSTPTVLFNLSPTIPAITQNYGESEWVTNKLYLNYYDVLDIQYVEENIDLFLINAFDIAGNEVEMDTLLNYLTIDLNVASTIDYSKNNAVLFPNPANAQNPVFISAKPTLNNAHVEIYDLQGRLVGLPTIVQIADNTIKLDMPFLSQGVYNVRLHGTGIVENFRLSVR